MIDHLGDFFGVAAVVIMTPGPDTALTIRNTLSGGRRGGLFTALGVSGGQATWAVAAAAGVAAIVQTSRSALELIRLMGAGYLVFLGAQTLAEAARMGRAKQTVATVDASSGGLASHVALRQGLFSNLTNPKMAVFFTSLLPQFTAADNTAFSVLLLLGIVFSLMTLLWLAGYAVVVARAGDLLRRPRIRRSLEALTGCALVALGLRLALERS
jgi:threonine/homoserine/homoserine lactone efflux protein